MKSGVKIVLSLLLVLALLAGCTGGAQPAAESAADPSSAAAPAESTAPEEGGSGLIADGKEIEIRFLNHIVPSHAAYGPTMKAIGEFEAMNPNVTVVYDSCDTATWRQRSIVEFAGGDPPALSWAPASYANSFIADGLVLDWRDIYADPDNAIFYDWFSEEMLYNVADKEGRLSFLPYEAYVGCIIYNEEIFETNGWETPKTFDELLALCDEMNAKGVVPFVTGGLSNRYAWLATAMMLRSVGIDNLNTLINDDMGNWDDPKYGVLSSLEKLQELVDHKFFHAGCSGLAMEESYGVFARGEAAMFFEGTYAIANIISAAEEGFADKIGIFPFPVMTDCPNGSADEAAIVGGTPSGYVISATQPKEKQEAALALAKYIAAPEVYAGVMEHNSYLYAGNIEYNREVCAPVLNEMYDYYKACVDGGAKAIYPFDAVLPASLDSLIKGTVFPSIVAGDMTPEEGLKAIADEARALQATSAG